MSSTTTRVKHIITITYIKSYVISTAVTYVTGVVSQTRIKTHTPMRQRSYAKDIKTTVRVFFFFFLLFIHTGHKCTSTHNVYT